MPRNGSGDYSLPAGSLVENGDVSNGPVQHNAPLQDIATALTDSLTAGGTKLWTGNQNANNTKISNLAAGTLRNDSARLADIQDGNPAYAALTGTNTLTGTLAPVITAYVVGMVITAKMGAAPNTGPVTFNFNAVGAGAGTWPDGAALRSGDLPANSMLRLSVASLTPTFHVLSVTRSPPSLAMLRSTIWGLTYANNGGDPTNDIDVAAGGCMDASGVYWIALSAITKRLDATWTVGTNQGGLDTGSPATNTDYYIWAIARSDTGVTDVLFSTSATAPAMPANYDYRRLIGYFRRIGSAIGEFLTYEVAGGGLEYKWKTALNSVNLSNTLSTTRRTDALSVPLAFSVIAHVRITVFDSSASYYGLVCCPDETDGTPGQTSPGANFVAPTVGLAVNLEISVRTSSAGLVASEVNVTSGAAPIDTFLIITYGFTWSRR